MKLFVCCSGGDVTLCKIQIRNPGDFKTLSNGQISVAAGQRIGFEGAVFDLIWINK